MESAKYETNKPEVTHRDRFVLRDHVIGEISAKELYQLTDIPKDPEDPSMGFKTKRDVIREEVIGEGADDVLFSMNGNGSPLAKKQNTWVTNNRDPRLLIDPITDEYTFTIIARMAEPSNERPETESDNLPGQWEPAEVNKI